MYEGNEWISVVAYENLYLHEYYKLPHFLSYFYAYICFYSLSNANSWLSGGYI